MKLINSTLYLEMADLDDAGLSCKKFIDAKNKGRKYLKFIADPTDARKVLIEYNCLKDADKQNITARFGNPMDYMAQQPIRLLVKKDQAAECFYLSYKFENGNSLPIEHVKKYSRGADFLNMLVAVEKDKRLIKESIGIKMASFYDNVIEIIKADNIDLPTSYRNLLPRIKSYRERGYETLIEKWRFNNTYAQKVNNELAQSILLELIAHPNQYDDVFVCMRYNAWAAKNNHSTIDPSTVGVWRRKKEADITISRYGNAAFNEKFIKQVKGIAPTRVGMLWESDDYNINYYFTDSADEKNKELQRYVSYIVADSKTGLVLGKSYRQAKSPVVEMVRLAYIDAMYYVRKLTGSWHLPFEVKADRWQQTSVYPFFHSIGKFVPPAHGNKHRGYIEQLFGSPHAKRCEKLAAHQAINYNGNNLTAINRGVNVEALNDNRKQRPAVGIEAEKQVEKFFWLMQNLPAVTREDMEAPSRETEWLANWNDLKVEDKRPITDDQFLLLFGFRHEPHGRKISITNRGIEPQINGVKYSYDVPADMDNLALIDEQVTVIYDPYDMSRVMVTNDKNIRFIARSATLHARALEDTRFNSRTALNMVLTEKKQQVASVTNKANNRLIAIGENSFDDEAAILGQFMPKELKNNIEHQSESMLLKNRIENDAWEKKHEDFLDDTYNLDSFYNQ